MYPQFFDLPQELISRLKGIQLLITDCDGVLTDNGVYYSAEGEVMKRFSIRDGMGVERLRNLVQVETAIMTGEISESVLKRAEKLNMKYVYLGVKDKKQKLEEVLEQTRLNPQHIAYIGDDTNDLEIMQMVGVSATPGDATPFTQEAADYICRERGGYGAFREFAELIIFAKKSTK
jgi:3-deoxy-D-manno-octulosonate 8-phosphate phosphatase (KDO 8-P phosphatase)